MLSGESKNLIEKSNSGLVVSSGDYNGLSKILIDNIKFIKTKKFKNKGLNGFNYSKKNFNKDKTVNNLKRILNI